MLGFFSTASTTGSAWAAKTNHRCLLTNRTWQAAAGMGENGLSAWRLSCHKGRTHRELRRCAIINFWGEFLFPSVGRMYNPVGHSSVQICWNVPGEEWIASYRKLLKRCICSISRYGNEAWTFLKVDQILLESFEMWCWRRMHKIRWPDRVKNEVFFFLVRLYNS